jgi:thioredoxin-like negative regulator of GroEL
MAQYKKISSLGVDPDAPDPSTMGEVPSITSAQHRQSVISNNFLVVIDNYGDWCGPCQQCAPQYAVLAGRYSRPGMCALVKEDVDKKYGGHPTKILGVPCFHFYVNGQFLPNEVVTGADIGLVEQTVRNLLGAK